MTHPKVDLFNLCANVGENRKQSACQWKWSKPHFGHDGQWHCSPYRGDVDIWDSDISNWAGEPHDIIRDVHELPFFETDLNACAEFERTLTPEERWEYAERLSDDIDEETCENATYEAYFLLATATARQRCLAFLKTKGGEKV